MPLPSIEFPLRGGLYTKARQDDVSALTTADNVDYYTVSGGLGKVPGTVRRSDTVNPVASWQSLHHHEGYLSGVLTRIHVGLAGTTLYKIGSDQSLQTLKTSMTAEVLSGVSAQNRLYLCSENNDPIKVNLSAAVRNWGVAAPSTEPVVVALVTGNVPAGAHSYAVTYVSEDGKESNRSDPSNVVKATVDAKITLIQVPVSSDVQVTQRRIYRDDQGDALYRLVGTIDDNVTTTFTDNKSNAELSSATAPRAGSDIDNSPPENMLFAATYESYVFGVLASDPNTVVWSEANEQEYWPTLNTRTFNTEVKAFSPILGGLLIFGQGWMVAVTGGESGSRSIQFSETNPQLGCVGPRAVARANQSIFLVDDDGPHLTTSGVDDWYVGVQIRDQIDALDHSTFATSFLIHDRPRYRILWFVDGTCLAYSYATIGAGQVSQEGTGVDPLDLRLGQWTEVVPPSAQFPTCAAIIEAEGDSPEVWLGAADGIVYKQDDTVASWAVGSIPTAISAAFETTYEKLFQGPDVEGLARYVVVKGSGDAASTWTLTLSFAQDAGGGGKTQEVSRTVTVGPGVTSKKYAVPRGYRGVYAKLKLENAVSGETGVIESVRLHFYPRPCRGER